MLGASGATGTLVVQQALAGGHRVTALARTPQKITANHANLRVVSGDATDTAAVAQALQGADAVISTLGAKKGSLITASTRAIVAAAKQQGVRRVVMLSSAAVSRERVGAVVKLLTSIAMGEMIKDKTAGEALLKASDTDWTIVYATMMTDGPATGAAIMPENVKLSMSHKIARADVAAFLVAEATGNHHSRSAVTITAPK